MTDDTRTKREQIIDGIAQIIDHPSVYMGGPSQKSLRISEAIVKEFPSILDAPPAQTVDMVTNLDTVEVGKPVILRLWDNGGGHCYFEPYAHPSAAPTGNTALVEAMGLLARLVQWDKDFPPNCWNGKVGLKELDKIIAEAAALASREAAGQERE